MNEKRKVLLGICRLIRISAITMLFCVMFASSITGVNFESLFSYVQVISIGFAIYFGSVLSSILVRATWKCQ